MEPEFEPQFIIIKLIDEIIVQQVNNHDTLDSVKAFMLEKFGENNYYVILEDNYQPAVMVIVNRKKTVTIYDNLFMVYFADKEPEIFAKLISMKQHNVFNEAYFYQLNFEDDKKNIIKQVSLEKYKYFITYRKLLELQNVDPTPNKKYFDWLCKANLTTLIMIEDYPKIKKLLADFDNPQVKAAIKREGFSIDINKIKDDKELYQIVNDSYYTKVDDIESGNKNLVIQKRKVYDDYDWTVVVPKTHEESVTLGGDTYWCTAASSDDSAEYFDTYTEGGKESLYIFINKRTGKKYQYSSSTGDFLDSGDNTFNIEETFDLNFIVRYEERILDCPAKFKKILANYDEDIYWKYAIYLKPLSTKLEWVAMGVELDLLVKDEHPDIRQAIARKGLYLDVLVYDKYSSVRKDVADQGYGLEILVHDIDWSVRLNVARQGYGGEILWNDKNRDVRQAVAETGQCLDRLIDDEDSYIRQEVAKHGYGLERLVHDRVKTVRIAVAKQGYGLDILINDYEDEVRIAVAEMGYGLDILINDKDYIVRQSVAEHAYGLDILINDEHEFVRTEVAEQGYGLDILVHDESKHVRRGVVKRGYGLDILVHDEDDAIRVEVAKNGYGLDILINDECSEVREAVAREGYGLDILINDIDPYVREAVARLGYGLEKLVEDSDTSVAMVALRMIKRNTHNGGN